jgi:hypothetical protein
MNKLLTIKGKIQIFEEEINDNKTSSQSYKPTQAVHTNVITLIPMFV